MAITTWTSIEIAAAIARLEPGTLPFITGIELTAIYERYFETEETYDLAINALNQLVAKDLASNGFKGCITDGHCIEWPSKVFRNWKDLEETFEYWQSACAGWYYKPKHPATVCGGGHIHLTLPNESIASQLARFIWHYPVIPWVFLMPEDTDSANYPCSYHSIWSGKMQQPYNLTSPSLFSTKEYSVGLGAGGLAAGGTKPNVIELRFFEAASNWEEQKLHLEFAYALATYVCTTQNLIGIPKPMHPTDLRKISYKQALESFKQLCAIINFDWHRCTYLFRRNLKPRWRKGYHRT